MSDRELLPRRPFALLPPEPGGFEAALARGRQRRRRTAGSSILASIVVIALGVTLNAPNPNGAARLEFTQQTEDRITRDLDLPASDAVEAVEPLELDAPAQPARGDGISRVESGDNTPVLTPTEATSTRPPAKKPAPQSGRRVAAPQEQTLQGGYATCAANVDAMQVTEEWCLLARFYPDSGGDVKDTSVAFEACRAVNEDSTSGRLSYDTTQPVDFLIVQGDDVVWQWSYRAVFDRRANADVVSAGNCLSYKVHWGEVDNHGNLALAGDYTLKAIGLAEELSTSPEASVEFTLTESS